MEISQYRRNAATSLRSDDPKLQLIDELCRNLSYLGRWEQKKSKRRKHRNNTDNSNNYTNRIISLSKTIIDFIDHHHYYHHTATNTTTILTIDKLDDIIVNILVPIFTIPSIDVNDKIFFYDWWKNLILNWIINTKTVTTSNDDDDCIRQYQELGWRHFRLMIEETRKIRHLLPSSSSINDGQQYNTFISADNDTNIGSNNLDSDKYFSHYSGDVRTSTDVQTKKTTTTTRTKVISTTLYVDEDENTETPNISTSNPYTAHENENDIKNSSITFPAPAMDLLNWRWLILNACLVV